MVPTPLYFLVFPSFLPELAGSHQKHRGRGVVSGEYKPSHIRGRPPLKVITEPSGLVHPEAQNSSH